MADFLGDRVFDNGLTVLDTEADKLYITSAQAATLGAMIFSYFNDSFFWIVTRFTGLEGTAAIKGWSGMTTSLWVASIPLLFILNLIV